MLEKDDASLPKNATGEKFLTFMLGEEEYGVAILRVHEIMGMLPITRIPRLPASVRGVVNLRGKVIPIMDIRTALELTDAREHESCIIVVEVRGVQLGIVVDRVSEVVAIPESEIEPAPPFAASVNAQCLRGLAKNGSRVRLLLDIERTLPAEVTTGVPQTAA